MTTPAPPFKIKANDRKPSIAATLGFEGSVDVPNLTGATVRFVMRLKDGGKNEPKASAAVKIDAPAVIVDTVTAKVRYDWAIGDTSLPGEYLAEWEVTDSLGLTQTFPTSTYNLVTVYSDLDGAP